MTGLPKYKSHKTVRAAKIDRTIEPVPGDGSLEVVVILPDGGERRITPPQGWEQKIGSAHHDGDLGYLVEYDDGYMSWSPSKAFEEGYTAVEGAET